MNRQAGKFKISNRGLDVLGKNPSKINKKFLLQFKEFSDKVIKPSKKDQTLNDNVKLPDELIDDGLSQINIVLREELLKKSKNHRTYFFRTINSRSNGKTWLR